MRISKRGKILSDRDCEILSDRDCELSRRAEPRGFAAARILYANTFSVLTTDAFRIAECSDVLPFYTRRAAAPLVGSCRISNLHPSLLPGFPGMHGVEQAAAARLFGMTATCAGLADRALLHVYRSWAAGVEADGPAVGSAA